MPRLAYLLNPVMTTTLPWQFRLVVVMMIVLHRSLLLLILLLWEVIDRDWLVHHIESCSWRCARCLCMGVMLVVIHNFIQASRAVGLSTVLLNLMTSLVVILAKATIRVINVHRSCGCRCCINVRDWRRQFNHTTRARRRNIICRRVIRYDCSYAKKCALRLARLF